MNSDDIKCLIENYIEGKGNVTSDFQKFKELVKYADLRVPIVEIFISFLKSDDNQDLKDENKRSILKLIGTLTAPKNFTEDEFYNTDSLPEDFDSILNYENFQLKFTTLWGQIMKWDKSLPVYRHILIILPEKVMDHLKKPLHMSDFLLESFQIGGPISLLSLHGIFLLMQKYNLEIPDFYTKLYSLFKPAIFYENYKERFFVYSYIFLSSTHLPEYLLAAFIKKLARLSLLAPTNCLPMIFDLIINIMINHPGLKTLVCNQTVQSVSEDPYLEEETDPLKSKAIESSLWEIKTLQNHGVAFISNHAKFIDQPLPKIEKDLDKTLSLTYSDIFKREVKRFKKSANASNDNNNDSENKKSSRTKNKK